MDTTTVSYNRNTRQWELTGEIGEVLAAFPAGPDGKHAAQVAQLEIVHPDALTLARQAEEAAPALNGRAIRGAQILALDLISEGRDGRFYAQSQHNLTSHVYYTITPTQNFNMAWHCSCRDYEAGIAQAGNGAPIVNTGNEGRAPLCKHILAALIMRHLATWPPACPDCGNGMHVKRDDLGQPFFSCSGFPIACKGRHPFRAHPCDANEHASMDRAKNAGLVAIAVGAQRRARRRELENARLGVS